MKFTKMQGLGNDYLYVSADAVPEDAPALSSRLSDRHFGVGADGMIWILPSETADFRMRIFNADGSEATMCGNGIRCVGKYVYDRGLTRRTELRIETGAGIKTLRLNVADGAVRSVRVQMGRAQLAAPLMLDGVTLWPVDVGNPHAVAFVDAIDEAELRRRGAALQTHPRFPGGVNLELVHVEAEDCLRLRVWERGSGITMACGTGACAASAAAVEAGLCRTGREITVRLDGGELRITVDPDGNVVMDGPAETVFEGEIDT